MQAKTCVTFPFPIHINFTLNSDQKKKKLPTFSPNFNEETSGRAGGAKLQFDYTFKLNIPYTEPMKI